MRKLTLSLVTLMLSVGVALPAMAQGLDPTQMNSLEGFLNAHPNTARELQQNPGLVNDPQWMNQHQGLEQFMSSHPDIRSSIHDNPGAIMGSEGRWMSGNGGLANNPGNSLGNRFDQGYLDQHPEVAHQLAQNPGLADNPQYISAHPGLDDYLNAHPDIRNDLKYHPDRFMSDAEHSGGYGYHGAVNPGGPNYPAYGYHGAVNPGGPNYPGVNPGGPNYPGWNGQQHRPLGTADNYFDNHPEVYQQMQQDPRLVDNQHYVDSHPGLQDYLQNHPHARQEFKSHPDAFMHAEEHYQKHHQNY
jgi:hypothetical protein